MLWPSVAKTVVGLIGAALIFFGVAFLGAAIALALLPHLGFAGSAAVTGFILLLPPCLWGATAGLRRPALLSRRPELTFESAAVTLLSGLARDKPLLAVLGAALFGAAGIFLGRKK